MAIQRRSQKGAALSQPNTQSGMTLAACRATVTPQEIAECLKEALGATTALVSKEGAVTEVPNWQARLNACQILLNYFEGRPIERQEVVTMTVSEDDEAVMARLMRSPAARAQLRRVLDAAE